MRSASAGLLGAGTTISAIRSDLAAYLEIELTSRGDDRADVHLKLFHLGDASGNRVGYSLVNLHFAQRGGDLFITSRSAIRINPNTIMRGILSDEGVECPAGLDGRHNVLGAAAAALTMDVPEQTELARRVAKGVAVRRVLEALVADGTLATRDSRAIYYLRHANYPVAAGNPSD